MYGLQWSVTEGMHGKRPTVTLHQRTKLIPSVFHMNIQWNLTLWTPIYKGQFICPDEKLKY